MAKLVLALTLTFAPFLALAYYYAMKALLSNSAAARYMEGGGGSIATDRLDAYHSNLVWAAVFGIFSAAFLANEIASLKHSEDSDKAEHKGNLT